MSLGISAATWAMIGVGVATVGTHLQNEQAQKANEINKQALQESKKNALAQQALQEQSFNKANAKTPDVAGILSSAQQAAKGGASGTMLTGPQGIDPNALSLAKNTLLGM